jgi:hypothetical protein
MSMIKDGKQVKIVRIYLEDFYQRTVKIVPIELSIFKKTIEPKFQSWVNTMSLADGKEYVGYVLTGKNHLCKFCGGIVLGKNRDEMCDWCTERFGTNSYKQYRLSKRHSHINDNDTIDE